MKIAVLVPAARATGTLPQALAGIRAQTVAPHRVLVVAPPDDEATLDVARQHGVEVLPAPARSPAQARNHGLRALRGSVEWVAFLDADDWWAPGWLEAAGSAIAGRPDAVLATGAVFDAYPDGRQVPRSLPEDLETRGYLRLLVDTCVTTSAALVRLATLPWPCAFAESADAIGEDYALWLQLAASGPLVRVPGRHVHYRHHANSVSQRVERLADMRAQQLAIVEDALRRWPAPAAVQRAARAQVHYQSAVRFLDHDRVHEARRDLRRALAHAPASTRLWAAALLSTLSPVDRRRLVVARRRVRAFLAATAIARRASGAAQSR